MGVAGSCCLQREDFDHEERGTGCCCQRCCPCCWCCCCGMCAALFRSSEEHDTGSPSHNASPSQSAGLLGGSSSGSSMPIIYEAPPDRRYVQPVGDGSMRQKLAATLFRIRNSETLQRGNGGNGGEGAIVMQCVKSGTDICEGKKSVDDVSKFQQFKTTGKVDSLSSSIDEEDICPTCLEGYDEENPKINTKCGHHFHLACILEWMERSSQCPLCDQEMLFNETP